ncbi:MAG: hypothetical protein O2890_04770 [Cyanobacteria bacterium]|nr:hypothetical protein [Cyanobacteriota bacterium]MDA0865721.1 hypothetical protein [Cyanobacteriota bacterium]
MKELCVLYHYHKVDPITLQHFNLLKEHNPDAAIIPVTSAVPEYLPGSVDVDNFPSQWDTRNKWRAIDTTFYLWFLNRQVSAERYIIIEYDCRCTLPLKEAYGEVWDAQVSCRSFYTPETKPDWSWFKEQEVNNLDPSDRPYIAGVVPYVCSLFSHEAVERMIENLSRNDVFCELRMGTAIRKAGLSVTEFPPALRQGVYADTHPFDLSQPGVYHPVKPRAIYEERLARKLLRKQQKLEAQQKLAQQPAWLNWLRRK